MLLVILFFAALFLGILYLVVKAAVREGTLEAHAALQQAWADAQIPAAPAAPEPTNATTAEGATPHV